jgi:hypothetical protein
MAAESNHWTSPDDSSRHPHIRTMTKRRIGWIAAAFALLVQGAFVVTYRSLMNGCCGGLNQVPQPPIALPHVFRIAEAAGQPLAMLTGGPDTFATFAMTVGGSGDPAGWISMVPFALLNGVIWSVAIYFLLNGIILLFRIRIALNAAGDGTRRGRFHLSPADPMRPAAVAVSVLVLVGLVLGGGALHRRWWLSEAKRVLHASVAAARTGGGDPAGVELTLWGMPRTLAPSNFTGRYARRVQPRSFGTHPLDAFAAPTLMMGEIQFAAGSRYQFDIQRLPGRWRVSLLAPCRGEAECMASIER